MRPLAVLLMVLAGFLRPAPSSAQMVDAPFCQHLDRTIEPIWHADIGFVERAEVANESARNFSVVEASAGTGLAYIGTRAGALEFHPYFETLAFEGDGGIGMPDVVGIIRLQALYTHRTASGFSVQAGIQPGFYGSLDSLSGDALFVPLGLVGIYALTPSLSALAGAEVYPDFDRAVDPRAGLRWGPNNTLLIDLGYPESRVVLSPGPAWELAGGVNIRTDREFQLEKDDARQRFIYDETRWFGRAALALTATVRLTVEGGVVFDREVRYASGEGTGVEDATFFRVGLRGYL